MILSGRNRLRSSQGVTGNKEHHLHNDRGFPVIQGGVISHALQKWSAEGRSSRSAPSPVRGVNYQRKVVVSVEEGAKPGELRQRAI